jgi:phospholipid transport system transporter-binding protein
VAGKRTTKQTRAGKSPVAATKSPTADEADAAVVQLPADCRLAAQAALKAQLQEVLHKGETVLDGERLERIDTAALQLLVLFRRELESRGGTLRWRGVNQVLVEAASLLGLEPLLNLPAVTLA